MAKIFDFIIVGAGTSGSVVASRLANTTSRPSVLLLEAGGRNDQAEHMSGVDRYRNALDKTSPLNWGYRTTPQNQLAGQQIDYSRGKGLGGSTAINFCDWSVGPRGDYDEWARQVGDDAFSSDNFRRVLGKIETVHPEVPEGFEEFVKMSPEDRGTNGPIHLSTELHFSDMIPDIFKAADELDFDRNLDINTGNPLGFGIGQASIYKGNRITAASAYLANAPTNLTIKTDAHVSRILVDSGKRAHGVRTVDGAEYTASKEVIISCGALSTPPLFLLSGIGPASEIEKHGVELVHELSQVGKNLRDHPVGSLGVVMEKDAYDDIDLTPSPKGWFKNEKIRDSEEFKQLPQDVKEYLDAPTVPNWQIIMPFPPQIYAHLVHLQPNERYFGIGAFVMNPQSRGTVTLASSSPLDAPLIDPNFFTHRYDRRVLVEGLRVVMNFFETSVFKPRILRTVAWPVDRSDEGIWEQIKPYTQSTWHMCGTMKMGSSSSDAVVDHNFKVFGIKCLRVVDLSVVPIVPNNHTQSTAYILGEFAAEKIIEEYSL